MRDINRELTPFSRPHHAHTQATHRPPVMIRVCNPKYREKLVTSCLLPVLIIPNACESALGAAGPWWSCVEEGEFAASAGRGRFPVGSQVGRLAR